MPFRTKIDLSDNRQAKQREKTSTVFSGGTTFGLPFSALTSGVDTTTTGVTENYAGVVSTFSGNTTATTFTWYDSRMAALETSVSTITSANSGTTQNLGPAFASSSATTIDGNVVNLSYSGIAFDIQVNAIVSGAGPTYTGTVVTSNLEIYSADTLDYTGRTIWIDNPEITRTKKLIITDNATPGYVLTIMDTDGTIQAMPVSGATSGTTVFESAGTGDTAIQDTKGTHSIQGDSTNSFIGGGENHVISETQNAAILGGLQNTLESSAEFSFIGGGRLSTARNDADYASLIGCFSVTIDTVGNSSAIGVTTGGIFANSTSSTGHFLAGGNNNYIYNSGVTNDFNSIIVGNSHQVHASANSVILGGFGGEILTATSSTIIAGGSHDLKSSTSAVIIAGTSNVIDDGDYGFIAGGNNNSITGLSTDGQYNAIITGENNAIYNAEYSSIIGGQNNTIKSNSGSTFEPISSAIIGGAGNRIGAFSASTTAINSATFSVIAGGQNNTISGHTNAFIGGGQNNRIDFGTGNNFIIGGDGNIVNSAVAGIIGGENNNITVSSDGSVIVGGNDNGIDATDSFIAAGDSNSAFTSDVAIVAGNSCIVTGSSNVTLVTGESNYIENGRYSFISGAQNRIYNFYSAVVGGQANRIEAGSGGLNNGIFAGTGNQISGVTDMDNNVIIGGKDNSIAGGEYVAIVGGSGHTVSPTSTYSAILGGIGHTTSNGWNGFVGGENNTINGGADHAAIIGGANNTLNSGADNSAIIGGTNITGTISNMVYVPDLTIDGLTSTDPIATDANGTIVAGVSDARLKKNITDLDSALEKISKLRGVSFEWTPESNMGTGSTKFGFLAQEVQEVIPEMVRLRYPNREDDTLTLSYTEIVPWLVEAIKELTAFDSPLYKKDKIILQTQTIAAEDNNIELNFGGTNESALDGGIMVVKGVDENTDAKFVINSEGNWTTNNHIAPNGLIIPKFTPTSTNDNAGKTGDITRDNDHIYIKTEDGWKRSNLETF